MHLSKKEQAFCQFLSSFLKSILNFEHFEKQDDHHSLCIFESKDWELCV